MENDPHRLPGAVIPRRYDLELEPDLDAATFAGRVRIAVEVVEPVTEIVMNGLELDVVTASVTAGGTRHDAAATTDDDAERITLGLTEQLTVGDAEIEIEFTGVLNDKLVGFYRSTFTDHDGQTRTIATTQMEATYARQAFPCWDEPAAKAVFAITLVVADDLVAVSNAGEIGSEDVAGGKRRVRFADTIAMSTYLVAFVVGPLEITEGAEVDGVPIRLVHPPGQGHLTAFALEVGAFALSHLSAYYDIAYPGDKLDLVAVPDFAFGAMENLGCVTFRETLLLIDPESATREELERAVDVISHEIAHMWFGDLVTMNWWNGIWLNEAFATFVEMKTTDAFRPEWDRWNSFGVSRAAAFDTDALVSTRPIEFEVTSPEEAEAMFDILTYEKGASVVRMLEQFVGEEPFRRGIEHYLRTHQFGNTETTDLWDAIEDTTGQPVRELMDTWIFQGGFPAVEVRLDGADVVADQARFAYNPTEDRSWLIPAIVTVWRGGAATIDKVVIGSEPARIAGTAPVDLVVANTGASGFYRTRYDTQLAAAIRSAAMSALDATERFVLVDDTWAFVVAGEIEPDDFVALAEALTDERDLSVWRVLLAGLSHLIDDLGTGAEALRERASLIVAPAEADLGPVRRPDDADVVGELRARLFEFRARSLEDPHTIESARALDIGGPTGDAALDAAAERIRGAFATPEDADELIDRYEHAETPQAQLRALYALTGCRAPEVHERLLEYVLSSGKVRTQNEPFVLARMLSNRVHAASTWTGITAAWDVLLERLASSTVSRMLEGVRAVADARLAGEIEEFLIAHPRPDQTKISQHIERMQVTVAQAHRTRAALG